MKRNNITLIQLLIISHVAVLGAGIIGATGFKLLSFKFSTTTVFMSTCIVLMILQVIRPMRYVALIKARRQRDRAMLKAKELESQRIIVQNFNNMNIFGDNNGTIYGDNASHNETHYYEVGATKRGTTKSEEIIKRALIRLMDEKDDAGNYLVYEQGQFYGVKAVLTSPMCGLPSKPSDFERVMRNLELDKLRIPYVYDSVRKIHPNQLPNNVELWHQYVNTADEYSLKQVKPAVRLIELLEEERE